MGFKEEDALKLELSGGKGSNLAKLTQFGFSVPEGIIITSECYRDFIANAQHTLRKVDNFCFDKPEVLRKESLNLQTELKTVPLPDRLSVEISDFIRDTELEYFSVRSSSTMEDLSGAAFAGQHDTFLNVKGVANSLLDHVKLCFISLWNDRALAYRRKLGFSHLDASMAVVVQKMVRSEISGVAFSINPINGSLRELIIDANYGLGESIVSGEFEVDHFIIDKSTKRVIDCKIAEKSFKIVCVESGTETVRISDDERLVQCADDGKLDEITQTVIEIENAYRFPQDIEWAYSNSKLYILQSRPITSIAPKWKRDESAERFPNVITPLTWDFVEEGFHNSLNYSFKLMGFPTYSGKWFSMFNNYIYGNQNAVEIYAGKLPFSLKSVNDLKKMIPEMREKYTWVQELPVRWLCDLDNYLIKIGSFLSVRLENKTIKELWIYVNDVNRFGNNYFLPNIAISITQSLLYKLLFHLLKSVTENDEIAKLLFDDLVAFCETKTGIINKEIYKLAQIAYSNPELKNIIMQNSSKIMIEQDMLTSYTSFYSKFQQIISSHGHREMDFDIYHPAWGEMPWIILDYIKGILDSNSCKETPSEKERELRIKALNAEATVFKKIPSELHFFFHEIIRLVRLYTTLDDLEHYQTMRLSVPMRKGLLELGKRLTEYKIIERKEDIFFISKSDIDEACEATDPVRVLVGKINKINSAKESYLHNQKISPEWILGMNENTISSNNALSGLPGSPGKVEGEIFIVLSPDDFSAFPKNAILVTKTTNPTWTPLFYKAAALITESGGPLSHGAVTARELQIPAVMSVKGCLSILKNGDKVFVDGTSGTVSVL